MFLKERKKEKRPQERWKRNEEDTPTEGHQPWTIRKVQKTLLSKAIYQPLAIYKLSAIHKLLAIHKLHLEPFYSYENHLAVNWMGSIVLKVSLFIPKGSFL